MKSSAAGQCKIVWRSRGALRVVSSYRRTTTSPSTAPSIGQNTMQEPQGALLFCGVWRLVTWLAPRLSSPISSVFIVPFLCRPCANCLTRHEERGIVRIGGRLRPMADSPSSSRDTHGACGADASFRNLEADEHRGCPSDTSGK